jgi:adenine phosphoribosyltransferase
MASVFNAPRGIQDVMSLFNDYIVDNKIEFNKIVGLDARGFPMAGALSASTAIPFSMARKKGKLPGETIFTEYELEYGTDELHLQVDALQKGDKVLVIDDVIATGGTLEAVIELIDRF